MSSPADSVIEFVHSQPSLEDYWRGVILFGRSVASYKFALGSPSWSWQIEVPIWPWFR
jgi:hypothetical protein